MEYYNMYVQLSLLFWGFFWTENENMLQTENTLEKYWTKNKLSKLI